MYSHTALTYEERFGEDGRVTQRRPTGVAHYDTKGRVIGRRYWDEPGAWEAPPRRIYLPQPMELAA